MTQDFLDMGAESPWTKRNGNVGAPLDVKLPLGEIDSLRWGLDGQKVEIFPDISHQYVKDIITPHRLVGSTEGNFGGDRALTVKQDVLDYILTKGHYPKQEREKKSLGNMDEDEQNWDPAMTDAKDSLYYRNARKLLSQEFPWVPINHIRQAVSQKKALYPAYITIFAQENLSAESEAKFTRLRRPRKCNEARHQMFGNLQQELEAAQKKVKKDLAAFHKRREEEEMERLNEEECHHTGTITECSCCYLDVPLNRAIPCDGVNAHFFCFICIRKLAETQIGLMKHQLHCFDTSGCQEQFPRSQLEQALGSTIMKKLDAIQQEDDIQQACLEGLESCPFCDFKAICPPVEEDREFRCVNPSCEVASCRLCKQESHIPKTCNEAQRERGLPARLAVEEAMSEALIRTCPNCKVKIIKEFGCNRMSCSKCKRRHRSQQEVEQAQETAIKAALSENPQLSEKDLLVHDFKKGKAPASANRQRPLPVYAWHQYIPTGHFQDFRIQPAPQQNIRIQEFPTYGLPVPPPFHAEPVTRAPPVMQPDFAALNPFTYLLDGTPIAHDRGMDYVVPRLNPTDHPNSDPNLRAAIAPGSQLGSLYLGQNELLRAPITGNPRAPPLGPINSSSTWPRSNYQPPM
ncbi:E3 ubiquitin-protein ligase [Aspergillus tanneri]|uniref:RING-type domain-containing protein n=2 Tax=Aspergillus tanneri TaxID=1220188 RepID=A0A5M9MMK6_9EURO|nr:uncharacterized protein ATNIH1004_004138 [Aspergillus tanneri]KAA8648255.1 hypothetical protein ATNIH1004_004138 [Aspergillus tanneri]